MPRRRSSGNWVQERDLEFFKGATRGPVERDYGKSATAEEQATVQVPPPPSTHTHMSAHTSPPPHAPVAAIAAGVLPGMAVRE